MSSDPSLEATETLAETPQTQVETPEALVEVRAERDSKPAPRPIDVILLGGGTSRRMGADKASLPVAGRRLIDHLLDDLEAQPQVVRRVVVVAPEDLAVPKWALQTMEEPPGGGPVAGLFAGIEALGLGPDDRVAVLTCDAPRAARMLGMLDDALTGGVDGVVALSSGRVQQLLAVYRVAALRKALGGRDPQHRSMHRLIRGLNLVELPVATQLAVDLDDPAAVADWLAEQTQHANRPIRVAP